MRAFGPETVVERNTTKSWRAGSPRETRHWDRFPPIPTFRHNHKPDSLGKRTATVRSVYSLHSTRFFANVLDVLRQYLFISSTQIPNLFLNLSPQQHINFHPSGGLGL